LTERSVGRLDIFADPQALAHALAQLFTDVAGCALSERGAFWVALAGGATPLAAYALLAQKPLRDEICWKDVFIYFGDERCVEPTDPRSNYRSALQTFLDQVPIPQKNVHRMRGELPPQEAATSYARMMREDLGERPRFDLMMLGMGKDGHTASLFPGTDPTTDDAQLVRTTYSQETGTDRLTVTPRVINAARTVAIAAAGTEKASALAKARKGEYNPTGCPVQIVAPTEGELIWLVDKSAAGML
jgi:6-phosphogluconolactonase